eukprot:CAMPEP_0119352312 /NCGR_PEP_ID=MMETSP1334-20130426/1579_1 /TAXON_ID=127549 /ORGANISM="Calcidiscus leptoporus, Strain RCC1130" /LENGTH=71 /DNA_ID=CAMNT_0007365313 /DNA_START=39 /DNA_END=254 /DNA_ORIENTATION=-
MPLGPPQARAVRPVVLSRGGAGPNAAPDALRNKPRGKGWGFALARRDASNGTRHEIVESFDGGKERFGFVN